MEKHGRAGQAIGDNVMRRRKDMIGMPKNGGKNTDRHTHNTEYSLFSHDDNG